MDIVEIVVGVVMLAALGYFVYTRIKKTNSNSGGTTGSGGRREPRNPTDLK